MFEWLLIGLELAILYFGFWFVWIRKPDVYRIKGDPWGSYESSINMTNYGQRDVDTSVLQMPCAR